MTPMMRKPAYRIRARVWEGKSADDIGSNSSDAPSRDQPRKLIIVHQLHNKSIRELKIYKRNSLSGGRRFPVLFT